jgi:membrane protein YqaA with SNARE-associated domain
MEVSFLTPLFAWLAEYGYMGAFAMSAISSATIILPVPYFVFIFGMAAIPGINLVLLTLATSAGAAIGELTGFLLGRYGSHLLSKKKHKWMKQAGKWFDRNGFLTLVFLAAAPLPTDIGGILAGTVNYSKAKFFLAMLIGKTVKFGVIVYAGYYSLSWVIQYIGL